jgi:hypothetical protein
MLLHIYHRGIIFPVAMHGHLASIYKNWNVEGANLTVVEGRSEEGP